MTFGEKVQSYRKKKGLSQEELADKIGVSRQAVQKWESGNSMPELNKLILLSDVLELSLDSLLKDDEKVSIKEEDKLNVNNETNEEHKQDSLPKSIIPKIKDNNSYPEENRVRANSENALNTSLKVTQNEEPKQSIKIQYIKRLNRNKLNHIKAWLIVGCILSPLAFSGSLLPTVGYYTYYALFGLFLYCVTIPLCAYAIHKCSYATKKSELIGVGVVSLILVSFIGGLLILTLNEGHFEDTDEIDTQPIYEYTKEDKPVNLSSNEASKAASVSNSSSFRYPRNISFVGYENNSLNKIENINNPAYEALIRKGFIYLNNAQFSDANKCFDLAIDEVELCGEAYLGKLLCDLKIPSIEELKKQLSIDILESTNFKLSFDLGTLFNRNVLKDIYDSIILNAKKYYYNIAENLYLERKYDEAIFQFEALKDYKDSLDMIKECYYKKGIECAYKIKDIKTIDNLNLASNCFSHCVGYKKSDDILKEAKKNVDNIVKEYKDYYLYLLNLKMPETISLEILEELYNDLIINKNTIFEPNYPEFDEMIEKVEIKALNYLKVMCPVYIDSLKSVNKLKRLKELVSLIANNRDASELYELIDKKIPKLHAQNKKIVIVVSIVIALGVIGTIVGVCFSIAHT